MGEYLAELLPLTRWIQEPGSASTASKYYSWADVRRVDSWDGFDEMTPEFHAMIQCPMSTSPNLVIPRASQLVGFELVGIVSLFLELLKSL